MGDKPNFRRDDARPCEHDGEKRPFRGDKKPFSGERRAFDGEKRSFSGEKRPFNGERKPFDGEKKSFGGERRPFNGERKPFGGERKPYVKHDGPRPERPVGERPNFDRKPMGEGRPRPMTRPRPMGRPGEFKPQPRPVRVQTNGLPARRIALQVIRRTTENGAYASLVLDELLSGCGLSIEDRRFAARLAYDTLQHLLYLDHALNQVMAKPDTDIKLRNILRLGACQLLLEDRIPEFAITDTCVELCKELGMDGLHGVCNGILRNLIRQKDELTFPAADDDSTQALSIRYSVPEWLVEKLVADYGVEDAKALMGCHQQEAVVLRPNLTKLDNVAIEKHLDQKE